MRTLPRLLPYTSATAARCLALPLLLGATSCLQLKEEDLADARMRAAIDSIRSSREHVPATAPVADTTARVVTPRPAPPVNRGTSTPGDVDALRQALVMPVQGVKPDQLFDSFSDKRGASRKHEAIDIPAQRGTPVLSATDGRILRRFSSAAGGLMIYATDRSERFILMYAHLDRYADDAIDGKQVRAGETIGYVGTTGNAPPNVPHLHFAISRADSGSWWRGTPINPYPLLHR